MLLAVCISSNAQLNPGFEQWKSMGTYDEPAGWFTGNLGSDSTAKHACRRSGAAHWGQSCLEISSFIKPGDTQAAFVLQSFPVNKKLNSISFYYRYKSLPTPDRAFLAATFFKGSLELGTCFFYVTRNTGWTLGKMDVKWTGSGIPDNAALFISTSQSLFNDTLFIDDIEMSEFLVGTDDHTVLKALLSVSRDGNLVLHHVEDPSNCRIVLRNSLGMEILNLSSMNEPVDLNFLPSGIYFYEMILDSGRYSGKLVL
jgi:hypothetical protein